MADDTYQTVEDSVLAVAAASGVLANDGGGTVTSDRLTTSAGGRIDFQADGSFAYTAAPGFSGTDTVDYERDIGGGTLVTSTVTFTVAAVADSPILRMADASVLGLTLSSADNAILAPPGVASDAMILAGQPLALRHGGYAVSFIVQDNTNAIFDAYLQVFGADGQPSGPPLRLDGPDSVFDVRLAKVTDGGFLATWHGTIGNPTPVSYRMFNADGTPAGATLTFGDPATLGGTFTTVIALSNDNYAIKYTDSVAGDQVQLVGPSGSLLGTPVTVGAPTLRTHIIPDQYGGFIAVRLDPSGASGITAQRYDADGSLDGAEIVITAPGFFVLPTPVSLGDGRFAAVWSQQTSELGGTVEEIRAIVIGADDQPVSGVIDIEPIYTDTIFGLLQPKITALADGFVVSRETVVDYDDVRFGGSSTSPTPSSANIAAVMQVFDRDGNPRSGEIIAEMNPSQTSIGTGRALTSFVALPDGGFALQMTEFNAAGPDFDSFVQVFDSHGRRIGNAQLLGDPPAERQFVNGGLALLADGELAAAWFARNGVPTSAHTQTLALDRTVAIHEGATLVLPLDIEFNDLDGSETLARIEITGIPAGGSIAGPAGTSAAFNAGTGVWTISGAFAGPLTLSFTSAPGFVGDVVLQATAFVQDGPGGPVAASAALVIPIEVSPILLGGSTGGDDSFTAPAGNAQINGLAGTDTVSFGFALTAATVTYDGNEVIIDGPSGSHTVLTGVERFVFADGTVDNADGNRLVDDLFYYARNHDVWNAHVDAEVHYATFGWHEGRDPNAFFDTSIYLSANPDVAAAGANPLDHWHLSGWSEGRVPSLAFDPRQYLDANPDVHAAHVDPLDHFLTFGAQEGREPFAPLRLVGPAGFDYVYYLQHYLDVAAANVDPLFHFQVIGWKEGRDPNGLFDTSGYLAAYTDVAAAHINPFDHYNIVGWKEGRDPSIDFDTTAYLAKYPDVAAAGINPLIHYLTSGLAESRNAFADGVW